MASVRVLKDLPDFSAVKILLVQPSQGGTDTGIHR
jgi:hypothetical protein